jgi:hypothetical protein
MLNTTHQAQIFVLIVDIQASSYLLLCTTSIKNSIFILTSGTWYKIVLCKSKHTTIYTIINQFYLFSAICTIIVRITFRALKTFDRLTINLRFSVNTVFNRVVESLAFIFSVQVKPFITSNTFFWVLNICFKAIFD